MKSKEIRDRFIREAQAMARLQHPNIVQFLGWVDDPRHGWFIAMEFVQGEDFEKLLERSGLIPPSTAIELFLPVLDALAYAHSTGVIHRDIKPANLMRLESGIVKVLDFGTAKLVDQSAMTRLGQQIGTSVYMPLEQLMGQPISFQADIYALGVTLYELITGKLPFYHDDQAMLVQMMMQHEPAAPSTVYPQTPRALDAVILKALKRAPQDRFRHALEFKEALMAVRDSLAGGGGVPVAVGAAADDAGGKNKKWWQFWK
jgi:serine/threonine-protein kinase